MTLDTIFKRVCGMIDGEIKRQHKEVISIEGQGELFDTDVNKVRVKKLKEEITRMASFLNYIRAYGKGKANVQNYSSPPYGKPF
jgi:hypothetical protein